MEIVTKNVTCTAGKGMRYKDSMFVSDLFPKCKAYLMFNLYSLFLLFEVVVLELFTNQHTSDLDSVSKVEPKYEVY